MQGEANFKVDTRTVVNSDLKFKVIMWLGIAAGALVLLFLFRGMITNALAGAKMDAAGVKTDAFLSSLSGAQMSKSSAKSVNKLNKANELMKNSHTPESLNEWISGLWKKDVYYPWNKKAVARKNIANVAKYTDEVNTKLASDKTYQASQGKAVNLLFKIGGLFKNSFVILGVLAALVILYLLYMKLRRKQRVGVTVSQMGTHIDTVGDAVVEAKKVAVERLSGPKLDDKIFKAAQGKGFDLDNKDVQAAAEFLAQQNLAIEGIMAEDGISAYEACGIYYAKK